VKLELRAEPQPCSSWGEYSKAWTQNQNPCHVPLEKNIVKLEIRAEHEPCSSWENVVKH
jgi:hypothetical protein